MTPFPEKIPFPPGTASNQIATLPEASRRITLRYCLRRPSLRFADYECLGAPRSHARAHELVLCPERFDKLLAIGCLGAAPTVSHGRSTQQGLGVLWALGYNSFRLQKLALRVKGLGLKV